MRSIEIVTDDITTLEVDAVVNAANSALSGGGGVDGAIHRAAGPELLAACRKLGRCPTGSAVITDGFELPARYVIHAVGPVWRGRDEDDAHLESAYRTALRLAREHDVESIAFPAISCGAYSYPIDRATRIAWTTITSELDRHELPKRVLLCCFDPRVEQAYRRLESDGPTPKR